MNENSIRGTGKILERMCKYESCGLQVVIRKVAQGTENGQNETQHR